MLHDLRPSGHRTQCRGPAQGAAQRAGAAKNAVAGKQGEFEPALTDPLSGRKTALPSSTWEGETSKESLINDRDSLSSCEPFLDVPLDCGGSCL